ncbi:hypothetical protein DL98DRAFT_640790 [Cadophora sp. DSE1049]|nr:hypothetical protein DL98DRAFT_640790 [Cadophora sp. DSE1049]
MIRSSACESRNGQVTTETRQARIERQKDKNPSYVPTILLPTLWRKKSPALSEQVTVWQRAYQTRLAPCMSAIGLTNHATCAILAIASQMHLQRMGTRRRDPPSHHNALSNHPSSQEDDPGDTLPARALGWLLLATGTLGWHSENAKESKAEKYLKCAISLSHPAGGDAGMTIGLVCLPRGGTRQIIAVCHPLLLSRNRNSVSGREVRRTRRKSLVRGQPRTYDINDDKGEDDAGETHETKSRYLKWASGRKPSVSQIPVAPVNRHVEIKLRRDRSPTGGSV